MNPGKFRFYPYNLSMRNCPPVETSKNSNVTKVITSSQADHRLLHNLFRVLKQDTFLYKNANNLR